MEEALKAKQWLEGLLGLEVGDDFFDVLGDGVLLCSIINTIKPGTIKKVNPTGRAKKFPPKKMENINNFIFGARTLGLLKSNLFEIPEFLERKRPDRLVRTLIGLEALAKKAGIDRSAGSSIMSMSAELEEEDKKKAAAALESLEAKEKEDKLKREQEEKERQERDQKLREEGKLKEDEYFARQEQARKERLEREEKIKKDRDEMLAKLQAEREKDKARVGTPSSPAGSSAYTSGAPRVLHGTDALLAWAARCCDAHGIAVNNFTTDWKDGMAFSALVAYHFPSEINISVAKSKTPLERLELAFDVAGRNGVPPLLDPEDVCDIPTPDRRSIITYLGCLHKGFRGL